MSNKAYYDQVCQLNASHCPYTWQPWSWWLDKQIDRVAREAKTEAYRSRTEAQKEVTRRLNEASASVTALRRAYGLCEQGAEMHGGRL